ncbi:hypothetical protein GCM10010330_56580 [Streptomyces tendae]|uniref:hypothetical protein n=1 Tax=Streptomyces tendae TaxID=1932 RepID=UPI00167B2BCE|nr:hypothetical protein [Streptomyces tendae]GHA95113.1 hypothetical protein GCM10010330_56580 [Streptomyces tendae]
MTTSFQTPQVQHLSVLDQWAARERNESNYDTTVAYRGLPASGHIAVRATADAVLVTATDIDVLAEWLFVQGGTVSKVDLPSGQTVWTLHTKTWTDSPVKFPEIPVHVTVVLPSTESVIHEIAAAVAA